MAKAKVSYSKGLNKDASLSKYDQSNYFDARNIKILTDTGLSTGSIINEQGNTFSFKLPPTTQVTINGVTVPVQTNLYIIGYTTIRNNIVLFSTSETAAAPTSSVGQIWVLEYDESTNTVINANPTTGELSEAGHLIYNNYVNFSTYNRIEAEGIYENVNTSRVYWTDNYNSLRVINISNPNASLIEPDDLDIKPNVTLSIPKVTGVSSGGNLPDGSNIALAYTLINSEGAQTVVSPTSALIQLGTGDPSSAAYQDYQGSNRQTGSDKSIDYTLKNLDTNYSIIDIYYIIYEELEVFSIYKFKSTSVPSSGTITGTLTGFEEMLPITNVEYQSLLSSFNICKTITIKDNILMAANVKTTPAILDFDARAYRYNSSQEALLEHSDVTLNMTLDASLGTPDYTTVPATHDCINPYNVEDPNHNSNWYTADQYKYQEDGTTIGGSGLNISYTFYETTLDGDDKSITAKTTKPHTVVNRAGATTVDLGILNIDGTSNTIDLTNEYLNFKSPLVAANLTGYARGEVYRFGFEAIDLKGNPFYVNWIGDIKFPDVSDGFLIGDGSTSSGSMDLYTLGIEFTIDISSIRDQISAFRFVRVERTVDNRTKLGTGALMMFGVYDDANPDYAGSLYEAHSGKTVSSYDIDIDGVAYDCIALPDRPGFENVDPIDDNAKQLTLFISPLKQFAQFIGYTHAAGDYLRTLGYYVNAISSYYVDNPNESYGDNHRLRTYEAVNGGTHSIPTIGYESFEIFRETLLSPGQVLDSGSTYYPTEYYTNPKLINALYRTNDGGDSGNNTPMGMGNYNHFVLLYSAHDTYTGNHMIANNMGWNLNGDFGDPTVSANTDYLTGLSYAYRTKLMAYSRTVLNQYGGNTYYDRSNNQYMSTGHFQQVSVDVPSSLTQVVYGGDTYVSYYDTEYCSMNYNSADFRALQAVTYNDNNTTQYQSIAIHIPIESPINMDLRMGTHFSKDRDETNITAYGFEVFQHNQMYRQANSSEAKFFSQDVLAKTQEEFSHRIWASNKKTDGELVDSWRRFDVNEYIEVNGKYGPINKITTFKDRLMYLQDKAIGVAAVNDRALIPDQTGAQMVLGTGGVLDSYQYISEKTGTTQQFSVIESAYNLYYYDAINARIMKYGPAQAGYSLGTVSDVKGLNSFFNEEVSRELITTDLTLNKLSQPVGVHAVFDTRYNRVFFTFLQPTSFDDFTISYNELTDAFESFYDFTPGLYINNGNRVISVDPTSKSNSYLHNEGTYCEFYGTTYNSDITLILAPEADFTKIFNNLEFNSEVTLAGTNFTDETISTLEAYNDYQTTGVITLVADDNIRRRMRKWRYAFDRDINSTDQDARLRDTHILLKLTYNNNNDKRLVLHDIMFSYQPVRN